MEKPIESQRVWGVWDGMFSVWASENREMTYGEAEDAASDMTYCSSGSTREDATRYEPKQAGE